MSRRSHCRVRAGNSDRSVHLAVGGFGQVAPLCAPHLGIDRRFVGCSGPATCVTCRSLERRGR